MDMVVPPHALVESGGKLRLHATYYITKQIIPALERVLNLVGADPRAWFVGMTKPQRLLPQKRPPAALPLMDASRPGANVGTIDQYYLSRHCAVSNPPSPPIFRCAFWHLVCNKCDSDFAATYMPMRNPKWRQGFNHSDPFVCFVWSNF